jgi:hypothetical protein
MNLQIRLLAAAVAELGPDGVMLDKVELQSVFTSTVLQ